MRKLKNEELNRMNNEGFKASEKLPICLVLDDIRSMHNVGSVFRTSDAFRIEKIWLCGITGQPPHREIHKSALGATETVNWSYQDDAVSLIQQLKEEGWNIASLEQADESTLLQDFQPIVGHKYAFVLGNEVNGVQESIINLSDHVVEIPQFGTKHSLNISVSCGMLVWDVFQKMRPTAKF